jgi:hypothetical protein
MHHETTRLRTDDNLVLSARTHDRITVQDGRTPFLGAGPPAAKNLESALAVAACCFVAVKSDPLAVVVHR